MLKPSKFNYSIYNSNHELLVYNSLVGTTSFRKIRQYDADRLNFILHTDKIDETTMSDSYINELKSFGYLVPAELDEEMVCYASYLRSINNNYLHLVINPTDACNFKCIYCYECESKDYMSTEIQDEIIKYVKKEIHKYVGIRVSWFGGEPLMAMNTISRLSEAFINICTKQKRSYVATITTNGYLLNLDVFKKLLNYRVIHFQITLDGVKQIHDFQRPLKSGGGTFDRIIGNLLEIKENCNRSIYSISLRTNYTKEILPYIDEYLALIEKNFMDNRHFDIIIRPADDWGGERVKKAKGILFGENQVFIKEIINKMYNYNLRFDLMKNFFNPGTNFCYAAQMNSFSINSRGEISKCTTDLVNNPFAKIGEVKNGFTINETEKVKWLVNPKDTCSCFFKPVCMGIKCPKAMFEFKNFKTTNFCSTVPCPFEKQYIDDLFLLFDRLDMFPYIDV